MTARRELGSFGERVARHHLEAKGFRLVDANVRVRSGEVDLLARDGADLVFVEVRSRRAGPGSAAETLTPVKLRRMWRCAMEYCEAHGADPDQVRLDVVCLDLDGRGNVISVEHLAGLEVPGE